MVYGNASGRVRVHLEGLVSSGSVGDRLPSVRTLMAELGVSPATVRSAVNELVRLGLVETISGSGTFIAAPHGDAPRAAADYSWQSLALGSDPDGPASAQRSMLNPLRGMPQPGVIDLSSGYPDISLQPVSLISSAVRDAARRPGAFGRADSEGIAPLRDWFAARIDPGLRHRVLIMPGGQAAISLIFRSICLPGDNVLMESPTYAGALVSVRAAGLTPVPVPLDGEGLQTDQLDTLIQQTGARVLFVQSRFQNPSGLTMSAERCRELIAVAERNRLVIIEDDWIADLDTPGHEAGPLARIDPHGHVVHVRSLTKSVAPGMRVAAIASSGALASRIHQVRSSEEFFVAPLLQEAALSVVTSPRWPRHLRKLRSTLFERRAILRDELDRLDGVVLLLPESTRSSPLHVWCRIEGVPMDADIREVALRHGVSVVDGRLWHPGVSEGIHLRVSNGATDIDDVKEGVSRLEVALDELRSR